MAFNHYISFSFSKYITIDSFIKAVFSGVIAPYHNFVDFTLDNNINDEYLPEIFEHILTDDKLDYYKNIFLNAIN